MRTKLIYWLIALLAIVMSTGCSKDEKKDILDYIPANAEISGVFDAKKIATNAGLTITDDTRVEVPTTYLKLFSKGEIQDLDELNETLHDCGIDLTSIGFFVPKTIGNQGTFVFKLDDEGKFIKKIEAKGYGKLTSRNGATYYGNEDDNYVIAIKDGMALYANSRNGNTDVLDSMLDQIKSEPMSRSKFKETLAKGDAALLIKIPTAAKAALAGTNMPTVFADLFDGYLSMHGTVDDSEMTVVAQLYYNEGTLKKMPNFTKEGLKAERISKAALSYLSNEQMLVGALALEDIDWDLTLNTLTDQMDRQTRMSLLMAKSYIEKIDGTVAIGLGLRSGINAFRQYDLNPSEIAATIVIETTDDSAEGLVNDLRMLLSLGSMVPVTSTNDGFTLSTNGMMIYVKAIDNKMIVASTRPIQKYDNCYAAKTYDLTKYPFAIAAALGRTDLSIDYDISSCLNASGTDAEAEWDVNIDGNGNGVLAKAILAYLEWQKNAQ